MACNCAAQEDLNKLYEKYGYKLDVSKTKTLRHNIKAITQFVLAMLLCILFAPFFLLYIIYKDYDDDRRIDINKILKLKRGINVG